MTTEQRRILLQVGLFIFTFVSASLAGAEFCYMKSVYEPGFTWEDFMNGTKFAIPFLFILTVHEFGHYFTAKYHHVKSSLPYYIPLPPLPGFPSIIGTLGAVIRLRSKVISNVHHFDIGLAGPLAGFIAALAILFYGFTNLPEPEYVFQFHPEYQEFGLDYEKHVYSKEYLGDKQVLDVLIGSNIVFEFFKHFVADPARMPNPHELMHYPILFAGFIALFFTALNLLPIGQLDGGHIVYGLFGRKGHNIIATTFFILLVFYSGLGIAHAVKDQNYSYHPSVHTLMLMVPLGIFFNYFCFKGLRLGTKDTVMIALLVFAVQFVTTAIFPLAEGYRGWVLFGVLLGRFVGIHHPPSEVEVPLDSKRIIIGWIMLFIFVICFSPKPLILEVI